MTTNYPGALDTTAQLKNDATDATPTATTHEVAHNNVADAIMAVEGALGTNPAGSHGTVASFLNALDTGSVKLVPSTAQIIVPNADVQALVVKLGNALNVSNMFEARLANNTVAAFIDHLGNFSAQALSINGTPLNSSHLSDAATLAKLASPTFTGTPAAPTASPGTNTTQIATTEYVESAISGLVQPSSGTLSLRPAASAMPHSFYYATDQAVLYFSDGTSWYRQGLPAGATTYLFGAAASVPTGWIRYDGTNLPGSTGIYADLYAHLGNTLALPDTRSRMPLDQGTNPAVTTIGANEGVPVANRRPQHRHTPHAHGPSGWSAFEALSGSGSLTANATGGGSYGSFGTTTSTTSVDGGSGNSNDSLDTSPYIVGLLIAKL